jgi:hypothetical protein
MTSKHGTPAVSLPAESHALVETWLGGNSDIADRPQNYAEPLASIEISVGPGKASVSHRSARESPRKRTTIEWCLWDHAKVER